MQNGVAPAQALPQAKQFSAVPSCVVQPAAELVQSFQPVSHTGWQVPAPQDVPPAAWAVPQVTLQSPQFAGSASTAFSQPLSLLESQSRHSPLHFGSHALLRQLLVVTCAARLTSHTFPQPPQLVRDVLVSVSQPLNLFVSHVSQGAMQLGVHALDEHELLVTWAGAVSSQILPQPLQLALSVAVLVVQPFWGLLHAR